MEMNAVQEVTHKLFWMHKNSNNVKHEYLYIGVNLRYLPDTERTNVKYAMVEAYCNGLNIALFLFNTCYYTGIMFYIVEEGQVYPFPLV